MKVCKKCNVQVDNEYYKNGYCQACFIKHLKLELAYEKRIKIAFNKKLALIQLELEKIKGHSIGKEVIIKILNY